MNKPNRLIMTEKLTEKFWKSVTKSEQECWNWEGSKVRKYGYITIQQPVKIGVHRFSWILHNGDIPEGLYVCHKCDNPSCCRPDHLFLGTQAQNMADKKSKGRGFIKMRYCNSKLTAEQIFKIREDYRPHKVTQKILSQQYGVSRENIHYILKGKSWKHFPTANPEKDERYKLSDIQIKEIKELSSQKEFSARKLAKRYNVGKSQILRILKNESGKI